MQYWNCNYKPWNTEQNGFIPHEPENPTENHLFFVMGMFCLSCPDNVQVVLRFACVIEWLRVVQTIGCALHLHRTEPDLHKAMINKCAGGMQDSRFCPRAFQLCSPPILFQFRFCAYQRLTQTQTLLLREHWVKGGDQNKRTERRSLSTAEKILF